MCSDLKFELLYDKSHKAFFQWDSHATMHQLFEGAVLEMAKCNTGWGKKWVQCGACGEGCSR